MRFDGGYSDKRCIHCQILTLCHDLSGFERFMPIINKKAKITKNLHVKTGSANLEVVFLRKTNIMVIEGGLE